MWATWVVAGVGLAAVAFMLRFLAALLNENAPSVCYWVVPVRQKAEKERRVGVLRAIYLHDDGRATESGRDDYCCELLENEHHAKEECTSGLVALDVCPVSDRLGWRSVNAGRGYGFRERQL
ncbi:MAG: hypothetical protein WA416_07995 [Candidatus Sulfotelmatobacter sp.]